MGKKKYRTPEERAWKVVQEKRDFKKHLVAYLGTGAMFLFINVVTDPGNWWFYWPMFGWGIGLIWHFVGVYGNESLKVDDEEWMQREYEKQLRRFGGDESYEEDPDTLDLESHPEYQKRKTYRDSDLV